MNRDLVQGMAEHWTSPQYQNGCFSRVSMWYDTKLVPQELVKELEKIAQKRAEFLALHEFNSPEGQAKERMGVHNYILENEGWRGFQTQRVKILDKDKP